MLEFEVQRFTRRCAEQDRELQPGEVFFSVLLPQGNSVQRLDYCRQAWHGPPENAIGWWQAKVPDPVTRRVQWAPNTVMLDYFMQLADDPTRQDLRYVLTLLLIRRRILRQEEVESGPNGGESLKVYCPRSETHYLVPVVLPEPERAAEIQREIARILLSGDIISEQPLESEQPQEVAPATTEKPLPEGIPFDHA